MQVVDAIPPWQKTHWLVWLEYLDDQLCELLRCLDANFSTVFDDPITQARRVRRCVIPHYVGFD